MFLGHGESKNETNKIVKKKKKQKKQLLHLLHHDCGMPTRDRDMTEMARALCKKKI